MEIFNLSYPMGESTLWWPKNVITNIVFQNYELSTSTKPILKEVFINYSQIR